MLTRIVLLGSAKVRPTTWNHSTVAIAAQTRIPDLASGGDVVLGTRERKGSKQYATGKHKRKTRRHRTVPSRADKVG